MGARTRDGEKDELGRRVEGAGSRRAGPRVGTVLQLWSSEPDRSRTVTGLKVGGTGPVLGDGRKGGTSGESGVRGLQSLSVLPPGSSSSVRLSLGSSTGRGVGTSGVRISCVSHALRPERDSSAPRTSPDRTRGVENGP